MQPIKFAFLLTACFILLSATPQLNSFQSEPDVRPITICGSLNDWKTTTRDTVSQPFLFTNLGEFAFPISTQSIEVQNYFNQGMRLYYGFNHREAFKAFQYASKLDPTSAMCWWGQALALGPHINMPMMDSISSFTAYDAIQKAIALNTKSQREQDMINALAARYNKTFTSDRSKLDDAYVAASRNLAIKYPNDADILALAAEAIMDVHYWDYWEIDGRPKSWTPEIIKKLETALQIDPKHPGANHFYIHAVEASKEPAKGLKSAELLQTLMPGAGHLVHMPSHIYIRTGQYEKGSRSNEQAVLADENYFETSFEEGLYSLAYYPHNYHFLWACRAFEGNYRQAMEAARKVQSKCSTEWMITPDYSYLQHLYATPVYTMVQFGKWQEIIDLDFTHQDQPYLKGVWQYARGLAFVRMGDITKAMESLENIKKSQTELSIPETAWVNNPLKILKIAEKILNAELNAKLAKKEAAIKLFEEAIQAEDALRYNEPADWHKPVRQFYGAYLISVQEYERAEEVYQQDLTMYPENGWSLLGLQQSLKGMKKYKEAENIQKRFLKMWMNADTKLASSAF